MGALLRVEHGTLGTGSPRQWLVGFSVAGSKARRSRKVSEANLPVAQTACGGNRNSNGGGNALVRLQLDAVHLRVSQRIGQRGE